MTKSLSDVKEEPRLFGAPPPSQNHLYILVRQDLPPAQKTVQGAHAVAQLVLDHHAGLAPFWGPWGPPIVVYAVPGASLADLARDLPAPNALFREPDLGNLLTAAAYWGPALPIFAPLHLL